MRKTWLCIFIAVVSLGLVLVGFGLKNRSTPQGDAPMVPAPTLSASPTTPTSAPSTMTSTPTKQPLADINAVPTHVEIRHEGSSTSLASACIVNSQRDAEGILNPPGETVGWYGPPGWPLTPGNASVYRSILFGHVTFARKAGVFFNLGKVKKGDVVTISYGGTCSANKQTASTKAVFRVNADVLSVPKDDVTAKSDSTYKWAWESAKPERVVTIFSCDRMSKRDLFGHSINNWIIQATRIS